MQEVRLLTVPLASHNGAPLPVSGAVLQLNAAEDGPRAGASATRVGGLAGVQLLMLTWLNDMAIAAIWQVEQWMEDLNLSLAKPCLRFICTNNTGGQPPPEDSSLGVTPVLLSSHWQAKAACGDLDTFGKSLN